MEPDIPHQITAPFPLFPVHCHKTFSDVIIQNIIKGFSLILLSVNFDLFERAVFVQRHAAMVEQIIIIYLIQTAFCQKEFHMLLQFITVRESPLKPFHDICFLVGKGIWILRINRRKVRIQKGILDSLQFYCPFFIVNAMEQIPPIQAELRMTFDNLALCLKLDDRYGFMHL